MSDSSSIIEVTDANFDKTIAKGVVLVDFWAAWCGPCRMVAPIVEQIATEFAGRVSVGKMDVDKNPATAARMNIRSIPSILIFRDGTLVDTVVGAVSKPVLQRRIEAVL